MPDLPFMMMNWGRFFSDAKVAALDTEAQGVYALLLGKMWLNQGWLSADDKVLSRALGIDVRAWKRTYKPVLEPLLRREIAPHIGAIYTQKHLQEVRATALSSVEKQIHRTAAARAAKAAKRGYRPSVTEPKRQPATRPVTETVTTPVTATVTTSKPQPQQKELSSALQAESLVLSATSTVTALPPRDHGVETESPPLAGKLPVMSPLPAMPFPDHSDPLDGAPTPVTRRLVEDGLKPKRGGLLGSLDMGKR